MAEENNNGAQGDTNDYVLKITGVSRDTTEDDVRHFLSDCAVAEVINGSDEGVVFVRIADRQDFERALAKDNHELRWQKVGVFAISQSEYGRAAMLPPSRDQGEAPEQYNVLRLRGLPFSASSSDILDFLKDVNVPKGEKGIHFSFGPQGRATGEAYVEVGTPADVNVGLKHDREHMGGRYIEVFRASCTQLEWECRGAETQGGGNGGVVRLRGLPFGCSQDQIRDFLTGINIIDNGITIQVTEDGRESGEAFVELETDADVEKALDCHKKSLGHRYIEVFRTTRGDIKAVVNKWSNYVRPSPYGRGGGGSGRGPRGRGGRGRGYSDGRDQGYYQQYQSPSDTRYVAQGGGYYDNSYQQQGGGGQMVSYPPMRSADSGAKYGGGATPSAANTIRMRGLPYSATHADVLQFFAPLSPIQISFNTDSLGRPSGEGEVVFNSQEDALSAMKKDRGHIGSRYVELFMKSESSGSSRPPPQHQQQQQQQYYQTSYSTSGSDPRSQAQSIQQYPVQYDTSQSTTYYQQYPQQTTYMPASYPHSAGSSNTQYYY